MDCFVLFLFLFFRMNQLKPVTDIQREKSEKITHFVAHDRTEQND